METILRRLNEKWQQWKTHTSCTLTHGGSNAGGADELQRTATHAAVGQGPTNISLWNGKSNQPHRSDFITECLCVAAVRAREMGLSSYTTESPSQVLNIEVPLKRCTSYPLYRNCFEM